MKIAITSDVIMLVIKKAEMNESQSQKMSQADVDAYEVTDKESLAKFLEKRAQWIDWLVEDAEHAIHTQIDSMVFDHAIAECINLSLKLAPETEGTAVSPTVAWFLLKSHAANQLMAIRRLCDDDRRGDTISLKRLMRDLKDHIRLFTRENFVCYDGAPFDPGPEKQKHMDDLRSKGPGPHWGAVPRYFLTEQRHKTFDRLLTIPDKDYRPTGARDERLSSKLIDKLSDHLGCCAKVEAIASKFLAHAADAKNRASISDQEKKLTFGQLKKCQLALCGVANFIGSELLIDQPLSIATPQFEVFEHFDKPWITTEGISELNERIGTILQEYEGVKIF